MERKLSKAEQCRNLMYKRAIVEELNLFEIQNCLTDMTEACSNIHYAFDDDETLINAFDGNEDEAHEFIMTFTDLDVEIERLYESFEEMYGYRDDPEKEFNDVTVALIGEWFRILGFDSYREDYFGFESHYLEGISVEESQKRIMRKTKKDMLELFMDLGKDHKRFSRECQLAAQSGIKLVVLVEEPCPSKGLETWVSPVFKSSNSYHYAGEPKSKANPATMKKIMQTMTKRYGVEFKFCRKADAGRHVIEILMGKE